jgi:DNA-binding NtrC family response regulator
VLSATNREIQGLVASGQFRADLFFRLNGLALKIPPLRERPQDIEPLSVHFVRMAAERLARGAPELSPEAVAALKGYSWPGNVRELRTTLERAVVLCPDPVLGSEHLMLQDAESGGLPAMESTGPWPSAASTSRVGLRSQVDSFEKGRLLEALAIAGGNQTRAARILNIARRTLISKIEAYGIERPRKKKE